MLSTQVIVLVAVIVGLIVYWVIDFLTRQSNEDSKKKDTREYSIEVVSGSITKHKADVVVNTIGNKNLEKGGVLLKQFLEAGAPKMEQELRKLAIPEEFGKDVVVTSAYGSIDAKFVFHAAVAKYRNERSIELLYKTIKKCLEMAVDQNATTIAFPTLGCGKLGFRPEDLVGCLLRAENDTKTKLKIYIVAFKEDMQKRIRSALAKQISSEAGHKLKDNTYPNRYPVYWKNKNPESTASSAMRQRVPVDSSSPWYSEVSEVVMKTWDQQKVGQGKDSKNLGTHAIKIVNIFCNESPLVLERYTAMREQMSKAASREPFHQLKGQNGEADIMTMTLGLQKLYGMLNRDANEVFLLHGTKSETLDVIEAGGLDSRVCGRALFGYGIYFTESSTKADQYTDSVDERANLGDSLYMYLCRVLLGSSYVCSDPSNVEEFKRPPCMQAECHKDKCPHSERYDSVVGTHRDQRRLFFREFVVYHPDQSYPDFLIEYQRVKCS